MSGTAFGRYRIIRELGRGAMAVVYLAEDSTLMREVAIKSLSPQYTSNLAFRERFQREGRILARVRHESIVPIYDFGTEDNVPFIVMEHMAGGTLAERIENDSLTVDLSLEILRRVASALDAAHAAGVIHRDLKPANILFDNAGRAFVGDFGVGRMDGVSTGVTMPGTVIGTAQYMSPEQVNGAPPTAAADIYSFGALAYETLVGKAPFRADNVWGIMRQHLEDEPTPPGRINPSLAFADAPILQALAKDPAKRPPRAMEITNALDRGYRARDAAPDASSSQASETVVPRLAGRLPPAQPPVGRSPAPRPLAPPPPAATPPQPLRASSPSPRKRAVRTVLLAGLAAAILAGGLAAGLALLLDSDDDPAEATATPTDETTTSEPTDNVTEQPTDTPEVIETAAARVTVLPDGEVFLFDTFDDPAASSVPTPAGLSGRGFMADTAYGIDDTSADDQLYVAVEITTSSNNNAIGIDAASPDGTVILTCLGSDQFDVRLLVREKSREFRVEVLNKAEARFSVLNDWTETDVLVPGQGNRLQLICYDEMIRATINTVLLAEHPLPGIAGDRVSFGADGGVRSVFDNIEIRTR